MDNPIEKVLKTIHKIHVFTPDILAQVLNMDKREVEAILGVLLSQGKIRIVKNQCFCHSCPLSNICSSRYKDLRSKNLNF